MALLYIWESGVHLDMTSSKLINAFWRYTMQKCSSVLAVWDLFTVGRGQAERKLIWGRSRQWKTKEGRRQTENGSWRKNPGKQFSLAQAGSLVPPNILCLHTEKFQTISQLPFQPLLKRGQIPSWLLTLYPVRVVAIMGKSKPLASSVGNLSSSR